MLSVAEAPTFDCEEALERLPKCNCFSSGGAPFCYWVMSPASKLPHLGGFDARIFDADILQTAEPELASSMTFDDNAKHPPLGARRCNQQIKATSIGVEPRGATNEVAW